MASPEAQKTIVRRTFNILNAGQLEALDALIGEDVVYRASSGEDYSGLDRYKRLYGCYMKAFSNFEMSLQELFSHGDKVMGLYRLCGTHTGEFLDIPPSDRKIDIPISFLVTFDDETIVEHYELFDTLEMLHQLGALPSGVEQWSMGRLRTPQ